MVNGAPMVYCPACGAPVLTPSRACPSCHEPLPAPPTVPGYAELPAALPSDLQAPDTKRSQPPPDFAPELAPEPPPNIVPVAPREPHVQSVHGVSSPADPIQVSRMAHSYPNPEMLARPPQVLHLPAPPPTPVVTPAAPTPATPPPGSHGPPPVPGNTTAEQAPLPSACDTPPPGPARALEDPIAFMETLPAVAKKTAPRAMGALGAALLLLGILLLACCILAIAFHASLLLDAGYWNADPSVQATAWLAFVSIVPAVLVMLAGAAWFTGSMAPRPLTAATLVAHSLWTAAALALLVILFPVEGLALGAVLAVAASWAVLCGLAIAALVRSRA